MQPDVLKGSKKSKACLMIQPLCKVAVACTQVPGKRGRMFDRSALHWTSQSKTQGMPSAGISAQEESTQKWASTIAFMALQTTNYNETLAQVTLSYHPNPHELRRSPHALLRAPAMQLALQMHPAQLLFSYASTGCNTAAKPFRALPTFKGDPAVMETSSNKRRQRYPQYFAAD